VVDSSGNFFVTMPPASLGNSGSGGLFYAEVKGYVVLLVPLIQLVAAGGILTYYEPHKFYIYHQYTNIVYPVYIYNFLQNFTKICIENCGRW
jgi:hypothetical protein